MIAKSISIKLTGEAANAACDGAETRTCLIVATSYVGMCIQQRICAFGGRVLDMAALIPRDTEVTSGIRERRARSGPPNIASPARRVLLLSAHHDCYAGDSSPASPTKLAKKPWNRSTDDQPNGNHYKGEGSRVHKHLQTFCVSQGRCSSRG